MELKYKIVIGFLSCLLALVVGCGGLNGAPSSNGASSRLDDSSMGADASIQVENASTGQQILSRTSENSTSTAIVGSSTGGAISGPQLASAGANFYVQWDQFPYNVGSPLYKNLSKTLSVDRKIGFGWGRVRIWWADVYDASTGLYDFTSYVNTIKLMNSYGLTPLFNIQTSNAAVAGTTWGNKGDGFPITSPSISAFIAFVQQANKQLSPLLPGGQIYMEISNEPNLFSNDVTKATEYATLFKACRANLPNNVKLLGPAITTYVAPDGSSASGILYLKQFLKSMTPDIVSVHLYQGDPSYLLGEENQILSVIGKLDLWISEFGYPTGPIGNQDSVSDEVQANNDVMELQQFLSAGAKKAFVYGDRDEIGWCAGTNNPKCPVLVEPDTPQEGYFGIMDHEWRLKPSGRAIRNFILGSTSHAKFKELKVDATSWKKHPLAPR